MQLKDLGKKVMTVVALTALLGACSKEPVETDTTGGASATDSSSEMPGRVDRGNVDSETISGPTPGTFDDLMNVAGDRVHFAFDSYELSAQAQATLAKQADWLNKYSNVRVTVEGHCDERGTREYNLALGARRSNAVKEFLVSRGVASYRVQTTTKGKEVPADPRSNEAAWAKNRRAEMKIN